MHMRHLLPLCLATVCLAEEAVPPPAPRPKIGLVLAGGSALGLAHVGVIQWLEEHRIPVDYVAGTSMGGLVAGLYATGHDSAEMRTFVSRIDWNAALAPTVPFPQRAFRRKEDWRAYPTRIEFGLKKGKLALPSGLSAGHGVGLVLSEFTAPYATLDSFDNLPTPFRCVATDLVKGQPVVFSKGSLFLALRATMSLPAIFGPLTIDDQVLVDGAVLNNLPVDVMKQLHPDIIIAVALDAPADPAGYKSLLGVAGRSLSVMIGDKERQNMGLADILVMPDLKGFASMGFEKYDELRASGYAAAESKRVMLEKFAVSEAEYRSYVEQRRTRRVPDTVKPQIVEVKGDLAPKRAESLKRSLQAEPDKPLDVARLDWRWTAWPVSAAFRLPTTSSSTKTARKAFLSGSRKRDMARLSPASDCSWAAASTMASASASARGSRSSTWRAGVGVAHGP